MSETMTATTTKKTKAIKAKATKKEEAVQLLKTEAPAPKETAKVVDLKAEKLKKEADAKAKRLEAKAEIERKRAEAKEKRAALAETLKEVRIKAMAEAREQIKAMSVRTCACGCGTATKSTFAPGHDAQLHSRILNEKFVEGLKAEGLYEAAIELKMVEVPSAD